MKRFFAVVLAVFAALTLAACDPINQPTADQVQHQQQEQLSAQSNAEVGMPAVVNFAQKKALKMIIELADKEQPTYSYVKDVNGPFRKICDSIGYPIPAATQYTNPMQVQDFGGSQRYAFEAIPQADPTGLFSPAAADATWVLCLNPDTHQVAPFYEEEKVTTSPFPIKGAINQ
jgi:hypothetical protein